MVGVELSGTPFDFVAVPIDIVLQVLCLLSALQVDPPGRGSTSWTRRRAEVRVLTRIVTFRTCGAYLLISIRWQTDRNELKD